MDKAKKIGLFWHTLFLLQGGAELQIIRENPFRIIASLTHNVFRFQNDST